MTPIKVFVSLCLVLPALALLIFGPRSSADLPKDRVIVDYWEKWGGTEESQMRQIVDDFNNTVGKEKGIYVRYVSTSTIDKKTLIATAAGEPPDIAGLWDNNLTQYASQDALEPLEELAAARGITRDYYKPVYWDGCYFNGHLWGLVSTPAAVALHYNVRLFRENADALRKAGLDPDRAPRTIEELDRYAEVLTVKDDKGRLVRAGYLPAEPGWYVSQTPLWFGGKWWDETNHRFTFTDPACVKAFEWVQSYSKKLGKGAVTEFKSGLSNFDSPQNAFLAGTVIMEQQGPWMSNYINKLKPSMNKEWAAAPFPAAVPGMENVTYCGFDTLVIPRGAKHKKEAFEFIVYVNRQDVSEKLNSLHCKNSPLRNVSADFIKNHPNPYIAVFEELSASPNAAPVPHIPIMPDVMKELGLFITNVVLDKVEPAQGLQEMQDTLQAKYDEYEKIQAMRREAGRR